MYTKCFSTLICCGWAYGSTLTLLRMRRSGVDFWKIGVGLSPSDVVMSWLRLQSPVDCIPHPFYIYAKCFSTLICCGWAHGCTLAGGESECLRYLKAANYKRAGQGQTNTPHPCVQDKKAKAKQPGWIPTTTVISKSRAPHGEVNGRYDDRRWISVI